jgi:hypothetical protein
MRFEAELVSASLFDAASARDVVVLRETEKRDVRVFGCVVFSVERRRRATRESGRDDHECGKHH